jgi:hypothetical protein
MDQELTALAEAGAAVLVKAMATDLWRSAKDATVAVFQRLGRGRQVAVAAQLEHNARLVLDAPDPEEVRQALFAFWSAELAAALDQDPAARAELARLVTGFGGERRGLASEQTNTAHGSGTVFAVQHGNQQVYPRPDAPS